jgi:hypothetical protein
MGVATDEEGNKMTDQPKWKLLANLGDVNPIDHGGYFVFEDETGVYPPEAEVLLEPPDDTEEGSERWEVYRFSLDRCKMKQGYLVSFAFDKKWPCPLSWYEEWFAKDLNDVASFIGQTEDELQDMFCSADPLERAQAYRAIGDYHGYANLDSYSLSLDRFEVQERYRSLV